MNQIHVWFVTLRSQLLHSRSVYCSPMRLGVLVAILGETSTTREDVCAPSVRKERERKKARREATRTHHSALSTHHSEGVSPTG